jgi:hypothetical protein
MKPGALSACLRKQGGYNMANPRKEEMPLPSGAAFFWGIRMSETTLKFLIQELETVRIICKNEKCGAITEVKVKNIDRTFADYKCPACHSTFFVKNSRSEKPDDFLEKLREALIGLSCKENCFAVEFVIPVKD